MNKIYIFWLSLLSLVICLLIACAREAFADSTASVHSKRSAVSTAPLGVLPATTKGGLEKLEYDAKHSIYPMFFVTNRRAHNHGTEETFDSERSETLTYGEYLSPEKSESIKGSKMIVFENEKQFLDAVNAVGRKKLAVFVHGYRKSFDGSMEYGLKMSRHLDAPLVVFAWPSKNNYCAYMADECTAEWSSQQLARVLGDLGQSVGFQNIAIVSHSLGARMVQWALKDLYAENRPNEKFAASLFFSPDVDRDTFLQDAPFLKIACATCKVYLDQHDSRIWISKMLHGSPRVGSHENSNSSGSPGDLAQIFQYDSSLPSHHIPFDLVAASIHGIHSSERDN